MANRLPRTSIGGYFDTIRGIMQAQVKTLTPVIVHSGEMGANDAGCFAELLRKYMPQRIGVDTGFVVNSDSDSLSAEYLARGAGPRTKDKAISPQSDILLVDALNNAPLCVESAFRVFPVETVLGVVEVTRRLTAKKLAEDAGKLARVRALAAPDKKHYRCVPQDAPAFDPTSLRPRAYVVGLESEVDLSNIREALDPDDDLRFNAAFLMDKGQLFVRRPWKREFVEIKKDALFHFLEMLRMQIETFPTGYVDLEKYLPRVASIAIESGSPADVYVAGEEENAEAAGSAEATGPGDV